MRLFSRKRKFVEADLGDSRNSEVISELREASRAKMEFTKAMSELAHGMRRSAQKIVAQEEVKKNA